MGFFISLIINSGRCSCEPDTSDIGQIWAHGPMSTNTHVIPQHGGDGSPPVLCCTRAHQGPR